MDGSGTSYKRINGLCPSGVRRMLLGIARVRVVVGRIVGSPVYEYGGAYVSALPYLCHMPLSACPVHPYRTTLYTTILSHWREKMTQRPLDNLHWIPLSHTVAAESCADAIGRVRGLLQGRVARMKLYPQLRYSSEEGPPPTFTCQPI